ncbi:hypothetical protein D1AOALGA4SA_11918 [Olavius algarvensis Delta 1 endosymbiont]|nr:hypothetical protein D1AOALGA4SA_11918 [Olavius algarvensis Delta 1 endosymbiont]
MDIWICDLFRISIFEFRIYSGVIHLSPVRWNLFGSTNRSGGLMPELWCASFDESPRFAG